MFEACPQPDAGSDPARTGERSLALLRLAAEALCANQPKSQRPPAHMVALHLWSLCHGIASLFLNANEGAPQRLSMSPEDLLEAGILVYVRGLGFGGGDPLPLKS
jgi:hypothetical protein